jgi:putative acetyltransferase
LSPANLGRVVDSPVERKTVRIRKYDPRDAACLAAIFYNSVRQVGSRYYDNSQVEAWAPVPPDPDGWNNRATDGRITLVAVDEADNPIAYGDLETDGHLDHLYASPEAAGTGAASAIYDALEAHAKELGLSRLYVEASEGALRLFERKGFRRLRRNEFTLRAVRIHNYSLEKIL